MTSYSVERPTSRPTRTRLAHLRAGEATTGQPVTVRRMTADGDVLQEFPAVFVRSDRSGHLRCQELEHGTYCTYRPDEVFPRRVTFRRWTAVFQHRDGLYPVFVVARTELEARFEALKRLKAEFGDNASQRLSLRSVKREG